MTIKTKKHICITLALLLFLLMLGIVGGMDLGAIPLGKGAALSGLCEAVGVALLWKGGVIRVG